MVARRRATVVEATETEILEQLLPEATTAAQHKKKQKRQLTAAQQKVLDGQREVCHDRHGGRNPLMAAELKQRPDIKELLWQMLWEPVAEV